MSDSMKVFENKNLDRLVESSRVIAELSKFVQAIEVVAGALLHMGKNVLPVAIGFTIDIVGDAIIAVLVKTQEMKARYLIKRVDMLSKMYIKGMAELSCYRSNIAESSQHALTQWYVNELRKLGGDSQTINQLLSG